MNAAQPVDTEALSRNWRATLGTTPPLGNELRGALPERWVRFHYLPDGARIATTKSQRAEVLHRFAAVLNALGVDDEQRLLVTTCGWGPGHPAQRPPDLVSLLPAHYWRDVPAGSLDDGAASVYVTAIPSDTSDPTLAQFLTVWVADALTAEAIIAPASLQWLLHPYDGGMDVIAPSEQARDVLAATFSAWLSPRPDGL